MEPLVSVIIPNYNYARYLTQRINSILNQSYKNIELIILDDCSTDNSREIIESYRHEERVKHILYNKVNSGSTFKQWKKGFEKASGNYIWIAECDDYADLLFLEKIINRMKKDENIKIGFSNSYWVTSEDIRTRKKFTISSPLKIYNGKRFVTACLTKENYIYNASMAVFRKDSLESVDPDYENYKSCGDKLFWSSIASTGKVLFLNEPLNYFRIHSNKVTTKSTINGTLFREEHTLFLKNIQNGYITVFNRLGVARYFIKYIAQTKDDFLTEEIYKDCMQLWKQEINYRNRELPTLYRLLFLFRFIRKR